ncbi:MAG: thiamine phosphate synthase [Candidatus Omnitrophica bacterium]|nr:thiamine phosphate synthase [Candidatus Omnitrophota bacterium]
MQLRAKNCSPATVQALAESILPITESAGVGLVINDFLPVAIAVHAPVCHLGQEDFFDARYTHVSQIVPPGSPLKIGLSSHSPDQANRALAAGAHYLGVGPVFATRTKPSATPATIDYVHWAATHVDIPWFAIGGIDLTNLDEVLAAGAQRIAVVSAILTAPDIAQACRKFKDRLPNIHDS